jgi:hypothetical protein
MSTRIPPVPLSTAGVIGMRIGGATSRLASVAVFPLGFPTSVMQMQRLKILSNYHHTPFDLFMHVNLPQLKSKLTSPYGITLFGASCCDRYAGGEKVREKEDVELVRCASRGYVQLVASGTTTLTTPFLKIAPTRYRIPPCDS